MRWSSKLGPAVALAAIALVGLPARADEPADPHAHHRAMAKRMKRATRTTEAHAVPAVAMVRDDGQAVSLKDELDDGKPVVLNFVFTTCSSICPVMSQIFLQLQSRLGDDRDKVHMVSISIDPEQDTPARLAAYAKKFQAGPQWRHYTGTSEASVAVQKAFAVYRGDKMNHTPVTFLRASPGSPWVRLDGFVSADELALQVRDLFAAHTH